MNSSIRAICFDVGGTLRIARDIDAKDLAYIQKLQAFIGDHSDPEEFRQTLRAREKQYRHWCNQTLIELSEAELWSQFMLPDYPAEFVRENGVTLNQMWRDSRVKSLLPDAVETIQELARRGYTLAIISNTTSSVEVPELLEKNGIRGLFADVILSTVFGRRKPDPSLFLASAQAIGIRPENCAYIGDNLSRDLAGARQAGFGEVVIINVQGYQQDEYDPDDDPENDPITEMKPDARIGRLSSLLDIYTGCAPQAPDAPTPRQPGVQYNAALPTTVGVGRPVPLTQPIKAILFDIGGTLVHRENHGYRNPAVIQKMIRLLQAGCTPEELVEKISLGEKSYKAWRARTLVELPVEEKWSRFYLPDYPGEIIRRHAPQLQAWWGESLGKRWIPAETVATLRELASRGYLLGTVSHTSPKFLREAGIEKLFQTTIHAAEFGRRKPHPSVFLAAARACGVSPQECAYVGDRPSRDVIGSREAGIGQVILVQRVDIPAEAEPCPMQADRVIADITALSGLFPPRPETGSKRPPAGETVHLYDAALSTMWWNKATDDAETFFARGRSLGFARFELNHQIPPEVLDSIDLNHFHMGTLHDPCPAVVPAKQLEREDRLVTSTDETRRQSGVDVVKYTIEQAYRLGARSVVIHPGRIAGEHPMDDRLRALYRQGLHDTPEYTQLQAALIADRQMRRGPHLEALLKSLREIVAFARDTGLSLGFENRFHYYELPIYDEMEVLLEEFQQPWVGWQFDVGHLQVHAALGLMSFQDWLNRFDSRIIGIHLHDVQGIVDHRAPGSGDVDFRQIAAHLPPHALRTLEVDKSLSFEEVRAGMELLANTGCIPQL